MKGDRVCVFCGSSDGSDPQASAAAVALGEELARRGLGLVYGGASIGLMGLVADTVLAAGGEVIGVIPESLRRRELAHAGLTDLEVVADMHERKRRMYDLSAGFIALPGGLGTLEEVFESATWSKLGLHLDGRRKPVVLLDVAGFYAPLAAFLDTTVRDGFVDEHDRAIIVVAAEPSDAVDLAVA